MAVGRRKRTKEGRRMEEKTEDKVSPLKAGEEKQNVMNQYKIVPKNRFQWLTISVKG